MLPARGRPAISMTFDLQRALCAADLLRLTDPSTPRLGPPPIQRLKDSHHAVARHLASGKSVLETADLTGLTPQRVGDLSRTDPAFRNLLAYYRDQITVSGLDEARQFQGSLRYIARGALDEIKERISSDQSRATMTTDELRRLAEMALDRTDAPPRTSVTAPPAPTHITFNMGNRAIQPRSEAPPTDQNPLTIDMEAASPPEDPAPAAHQEDLPNDPPPSD